MSKYVADEASYVKYKREDMYCRRIMCDSPEGLDFSEMFSGRNLITRPWGFSKGGHTYDCFSICEYYY